jgi:electron transfer flavoprotein beta subunit
MEDIIVCVKQVPNTTEIKLDPINHTLIREGVDSILNPFDEIALEAALDCRSRYGLKVGVLTMGPPQAEQVLRQALSWGADDAFLLSDRRLAGSDTLATARALHAAIRSTGYRTVFCGQETIDSSTGHLGPSLAEMFGLPQAAYVTRIIESRGPSIQVEVERDRSLELLELRLPAVISFAKANRKARFASTNRKGGEIKRLKLEDIGLDEEAVGLKGSPTAVVDIDINTDSLNYLIVDNSLSAVDRINAILGGGIEENERRVIFKSFTKEAGDSLLAMLR